MSRHRRHRRRRPHPVGPGQARRGPLGHPPRRSRRRGAAVGARAQRARVASDRRRAAGVRQPGRRPGDEHRRQAVLAAGFDESVPATTIDRQCGSSQQAAHFAAQGVIAGAYDIVIAGGRRVDEPGAARIVAARAVRRSRRVDERYPDGLVNQGVSAELIAQKWGSVARGAGRILGRVAPQGGGCGIATACSTRSCSPRGRREASRDRRRDRARRHHGRGLGGLNPRSAPTSWARVPGPRLADHAGQLLAAHRWRIRCTHHERGEGDRTRAHAAGALPRVRVVGDDPLFMLTGPIPATRRDPRAQRPVARRPRRVRGERGVRLGAARLGEGARADPDKLNPWGGAIALGHAWAASGTRLLGTLLAHARGDRRAVRAADDVRGRRHGQRDDHRAAVEQRFASLSAHAVPRGAQAA